MSMTLVRSYFIARCKFVGLKEHIDAFNEDNIPANFINGAFHVLLETFNGIKLNQSDQEIDCDVRVTFWIKGFKRPTDGLDRAVAKSEELLKEVLKNSNRLGQCLKNVTFNSVDYEALSVSNDNAVKVTMRFTAFTSLDIT